MKRYYLTRDTAGKLAGFSGNPKFPGQESITDDHPDFLAWKEAIEQTEIDSQALSDAKESAINDNLPDWATVETAVDNIGSLADAKTFIKKLARVVYWLVKNKAD
jgi:hypothetical protein